MRKNGACCVRKNGATTDGRNIDPIQQSGDRQTEKNRGIFRIGGRLNKSCSRVEIIVNHGKGRVCPGTDPPLSPPPAVPREPLHEPSLNSAQLKQER